MRPRPPGSRYALEIVVVLVVKFVALFVIWSIWFAGPSRKDVGAERAAERAYSSQPAAPAEGAIRAARP
jgi:hypothetical protein